MGHANHAVATLRALVLVAIVASAPSAHAAGPPYTVGVLLDGAWQTNPQTIEVFKTELEAVTRGTVEVRFPEDKRVIGNWDGPSVRAGLDKLLADKEVDVILALGLIASHEAGQAKALSKPVVAPLVVDPDVQGLPYDPKSGTTGRRNYTFICTPGAFERDLVALRDLTKARKIVFLTTEGFRSAIPPLADNAKRVADKQDVELTAIDVAESAQAALDALPADTEAVYVGALLRLSEAETTKLAEGLAAKRLPSFSIMGRTGAARGFLAAVSAGLDIERRAKRAALDIERVLVGRESLADMKVVLSRRERLIINMTAARKQSFWPSFTVLTEAELLNPERGPSGATLTLPEAARIAVTENLDLLANAKEVAAGAEEIRRARANILPQVSIGATGLVLDSDRTSALQNQAEVQLNASGTLTQPLYSENAYANLSIQKYLQDSRELQRRGLVLDTIRNTAVAYLDVLRALTFERIQRDNLALTRSNLELAEVRRSIGVAGPSEVYRWQSQLANDRGSVISAIANRNAAEIALNRQLNRPLESSVQLDEAALKNPLERLGNRAVFGSFDNPWAFKIFRRFMVTEGLVAAPELKAVDAGIAATERRITAAGRAWWLPTFALQGQIDQVLAQGGSGSEDFDASSLPPGIDIASPNDTSWSVALTAQIPLFAGLGRHAEQTQAELTLSQTQLERKALAQRIEQRIRTALHQTGASFANIRLSEDAAAAAAKNLEVVQDAYARGALTYLNLLDAQNAALVARQVAANAVYDFLVDFTEVQRATSRFDLFSSPDERAAWEKRLNDYLQKAGHDVASSPDATPSKR